MFNYKIMRNFTKEERRKSLELMASLDRKELRLVLWVLRRQDARPSESNPAAAQYDGLITTGGVRAEYRRRGWKIPKPTRGEQN